MALVYSIISGRHGPAQVGAGFSRTIYTEDMPLLAIGPAPLELNALVAALGDRVGADGAVVTFLGLVRNHNAGRRVQHLEYEARVALHHRIGRLEVGEASVAIAVASAHRAEAYAACRYVIERVKQIAPIWKREFFEGGDVWIEGATADPEDARARAEAERVACA
jgi:molybdopterin synthase catalytic subunit